MRLRILFGSVLLVLGLAVYAIVVIAAARLLPDNQAAALAFYALAGIAWIFPAAKLTRWMQRAGPFRAPPE